MPSAEELEQLLENAEEYLDAYEISRLEQMDRAAKLMDAHDREVDDGNEIAASSVGE